MPAAPMLAPQAYHNLAQPVRLGNTSQTIPGVVAGLATITPAAGYVSPSTAVSIGIVSGIVWYFAVEIKNKLQWDDALDV